MIEIAIPSLDRAVIDELEIATAQRLVGVIAETFNARATAAETSARADPFPGSSSGPPGSSGST